MLLRPDATEPIPESDPLPPNDRVPAIIDSPLDDLFRRHQPQLLRQLVRNTSRDTAPDLCQDAFLRFATAAATRTIGNPIAYLRRAVGNLAIDHLRRAVRRPDTDPRPLDEAVAAPDQIRALEARDMLRRLEEALGRLKPRTREIFLAHRLDGYSYAEIAARTGLSVKAVEKHMSRAIAHIAQLDARR